MNLKNLDWDLIRRIHLECGFYEFMIRFWICLKKPKIRFWIFDGNPDLHFPKKNAPKVRCLWSQLWLAAAKLDALVKAAFTLQGSGVIEKRSNELFFIIWIKCFYEFLPHIRMLISTKCIFPLFLVFIWMCRAKCSYHKRLGKESSLH